VREDGLVFKRVIWWASGAVMGAGGSAWVQRKVKRTVRTKRAQYAPTAVAGRVGDRLTSSVRGVGETVRDVIDEGRAGMRERESELRAELGTRVEPSSGRDQRHQFDRPKHRGRGQRRGARRS
jgi:hypothetical protein